MKTKPKIGVAALATLLFASCSFAAEFMPDKVLRWGGNSEGGVPFILYDPSEPEKLTGFETEIAAALAAKMGLKPQFVQNVWDILIPGLQRRLYDIAINGIEVTPERQETINFSIPYYVTYLQMVVPKGNPAGVSTLENARGHTIGTLRGSYAYETLAKAGIADIRSYENEATAYQDMQNGRLDAVVMDAPMSIYYSQFNPMFEFVGEPIGRMEYAMTIRKGEEAFLKRVNEAIVALRDDGTLRRIYDRWNLWNPLMAGYFNDDRPALEKPVMYEHWADIQRGARSWPERIKRYVGFLPSFGRAAVVTLEVSIASMALALAVGLFIAVCRLFGPLPLRVFATCYTEFIRGTPVMIQLFFIFYGLPNVGVQLSPFVAGTLALGLNYAAYESENYRAGLEAVPRAQMEGALALGMTKREALRHVILPQAIRVSLLPMTNDFIALLKDSSLVSIITLVDLTRTYGQLATVNYDYFGTGFIVAVIYLLIGTPFVRIARKLEKKLNVSLRGRRVFAVHRAANYNE
ncbi:ABC transporter substrate-binding protein/permease [Pyramidobacter piscolens]|uniref:ABC transporter substrate-binding protein/permease n=1 Tax=Pyramidobacter piscolens TaxID=638849 RepID=UPI0025829E04|nr:ABC transporter substrate-binding protein/permease [Pyramidobacter piscolens]